MIRADALPPASYTVPEVESLLGLSTKGGYRLIREHKLQGHRDVTGKMRVSHGALYTYLTQLENK